MLHPMIEQETPEQVPFYRVSGPAGHADYLPCEGWLRLVAATGGTRMLDAARERDAQRVHREHGRDGLRRFLNRCYDELELDVAA